MLLERVRDLGTTKATASLQDDLHHLIENLKSPGGLESRISLRCVGFVWFCFILKFRGMSEDHATGMEDSDSL